MWQVQGGSKTTDVQSTTWIWGLHADAHDFQGQVAGNGELAARIFATHFGHLAVVSAWLSALFYGGARCSNYEMWLTAPTRVKPAAQIVYGSQALLQDNVNGETGAGSSAIRITTGLFSIWRAAGITCDQELFVGAISFLSLAALFIAAGWYHNHVAVPRANWFNDIDAILNHHLTAVIGLGSLAWAGHLIHVSIPTDTLLYLGCDPCALPEAGKVLDPKLAPLLLGGGTLSDVFTLNWQGLSHGLTLLGGLNPSTGSLWLTDVAHHHVAVAVVFLLAGHLYRTQFSVGTRLTNLLSAHGATFTNSWHAQLAINLGILGTVSILTGHLLIAFPAYPFLAMDWAAALSLFTHHAWIGGFFIVGSGAHAALFLVGDYRLWSMPGLERVLAHRHSVVVHLNWVSIFLGFHAFGMYIHNDTLLALGRREDQFADTGISFQPVIGFLGQSVLQAELAVNEATSYTGTRLTGTADLLVHHIHAFTIHVTALILVKGVLFARSSRLVIDKHILGFRFPCDGPGRGGTCQVSSWDHVYLGLFWMYNCISVVIFHFSWKLQSNSLAALSASGTSYVTGGSFALNSVTINGWLRDFLWSESSQVIQSYGSQGGSYGLLFLGAHFVWAFSLMFLFSGRGYWQELIEALVWAHATVAVAPTIYPRALSITQGRAVGITHPPPVGAA
jgi:photosystem I P700 chlorophyll a apoprotein A1